MITKLLKEFENTISFQGDLINALQLFDLKSFEERLFSLFMDLYRSICEYFVSMFCNSDYFKQSCKSKQIELGARKLKQRKVSLRVCTGDTIHFTSAYMSKVKQGSQGDRQLFHRLFDTVSGNSPTYTSRVAQQAVMAPSFDVGTNLLKGVGVNSPISRTRSLSLDFGQQNLRERVDLQLKQGESLAGKVVVVSVDGGRSRMREYNGKKNEENTHELYDTPWREPKLLVIHQIDQKTGKQSKQELPLYDCCYGDDECFELLGAYLKAMQIDKAAHVQFIADGAIWIWNRVESFLCDLGVEKKNITQTLDYYHAMEHLGVLIEKLPPSVTIAERVQLRIECKDLLWKGKIDQIIKKVRELTKSKYKLLVREINYFEKHKERCCYSLFKNSKLLCGSGIIESGVRRVINLRFKGPASFWKMENIEPLIYLRAAFLSKRWDIIWENRLRIKRGQM